MTDTAIAPAEERSVETREDYEARLLEQVVIMGDLAKLTPEQRSIYYREVCNSLGLNPLTKPFDYIVLNGALRLYANKTAAEQLRKNHGIEIEAVEHSEVDGLYIATVHGHDRSGRKDTDVGAVDIANLRGEKRANAIMKTITKGKRRLTLSLAGLGWLDESEVGSIDNAQTVDVDPETGEILEESTLTDTIAAKRAAITSGSGAQPRSEAGPEREEGDATVSWAGGAEPPPPAAPDEGDPGPVRAETPGSRRGSDPTTTPGSPDEDDAGTPSPSSVRAKGSKGEEPGATPADASDGTSSPSEASPAERCSGFDDELGRCTKDAQHAGNHADVQGQTWS